MDDMACLCVLCKSEVEQLEVAFGVQTNVVGLDVCGGPTGHTPHKHASIDMSRDFHVRACVCACLLTHPCG